MKVVHDVKMAEVAQQTPEEDQHADALVDFLLIHVDAELVRIAQSAMLQEQCCKGARRLESHMQAAGWKHMLRCHKAHRLLACCLIDQRECRTAHSPATTTLPIHSWCACRRTRPRWHYMSCPPLTC